MVSELTNVLPWWPFMVFATVVAALAVTALANAVLMLFLGVFEFGNLIRFIPYPVIGGFLGGTGYLLVKGSLDVMTTISIDGTTLGLLFEGEVLPLWLVGVAYGVVLTYASSRYQHFPVMPGLLLGGGLGMVLSGDRKTTSGILRRGSACARSDRRGWLPDRPGR